MRRFIHVRNYLLLIVAFVISLSGCAGLSQQYKASTEGIPVNYTVNKEQFVDPKAKVFISSSDERLDKEVIAMERSLQVLITTKQSVRNNRVNLLEGFKRHEKIGS